jgi:hypothetical protein
MVGDPCKSDRKRVLLVEGKDDCHVVMSLCNHFGVPETFGPYECGGVDQLLKRLNALISAPDPPDVIGVLLDADADLGNRWQQIKSKLNHYGYEFPTNPVANGTIIEMAGGLPKLGIWLMPNNQIEGMLEDFCLEMITDKNRLAAEAAVTKAEQDRITTFIPNHRAKAIVHTFLAWQNEPGDPLGLAITRQALLPETDTAKTFVDWLKQLFGAV